jgi:pre-mRNA-splicing helicase BRR2
MRSDADEHVNVEVAMREKGVGWILRELAGDRQAKPRSDTMDVDEPKIEVPKTATVAPGSIVQPKRTVDLDSMAFNQGGHLMSNKKCKLPDGSFKRAKKGYEEIHVPAPKQKPTTESDFVPISAPPAWAREAFTVPKLNRVQSKVFPVAFGTDEPILLCAPTGAGKACLSC